MSTENALPESSDTSELDESNRAERRRSTTVIMTVNVSLPHENTAADASGVRRNGSVRRRLSKQNATIEEPASLLSISDDPSESCDTAVPCIEEHPEEGAENDADETPTEKKDGTKLQPPGLTQKKMWSTTKSWSRESNGTEYSDRSGTDLRTFVDRTLHKSEEDRKQLLCFEKELRELILDNDAQSKKFELPSSYHRMLLHRVAAWFGLDHNVTNKQTDIVVNKSEKTKMPDEIFSDYIRHDSYAEDRSQRQNAGSSRKELHHMESFGDRASQYGSQASLNHDLLMMRRAQSFDVAAVTGPSVIQAPPPSQDVRALPIKQLSLNCSPHPMVATTGAAQGHQWAPQRSLDYSNNSYLYTGKHPMMRKAESFGGMANGLSHGYYEASVPVVCGTPPSVMLHQQPPSSNYTGYQVFDELPMTSANYQPMQDAGTYSPGSTTYYDYVPQVMAPQQQFVRPIRYLPHEYHQRRPQSAGMQYMYGPPQQYAPQFQSLVHPNVDIFVDSSQAHAHAQPFPPVGHFVIPSGDQQQGYSSSHQATTANSFIKASIDGGYGSMNQDTDSAGNAEKVEEIVQQ